MTQREKAAKLIKAIRRELAQGYDFVEDIEDPAQPPVAAAEWSYSDEGIKNLTDALAALQRQPGRQ